MVWFGDILYILSKFVNSFNLLIVMVVLVFSIVILLIVFFGKENLKIWLVYCSILWMKEIIVVLVFVCVFIILSSIRFCSNNNIWVVLVNFIFFLRLFLFFVFFNNVDFCRIYGLVNSVKILLVEY